MFDPMRDEMVTVQVLEEGESTDAGSINVAAILTHFRGFYRNGSVRGPVEYHRLILRDCGHVRCANDITYNLN